MRAGCVATALCIFMSATVLATASTPALVLKADHCTSRDCAEHDVRQQYERYPYPHRDAGGYGHTMYAGITTDLPFILRSARSNSLPYS